MVQGVATELNVEVLNSRADPFEKLMSSVAKFDPQIVEFSQFTPKATELIKSGRFCRD